MKPLLTRIFLLTVFAPLMSLAQSTITISPLDKTHIQVEYQLPKQCSTAVLQEKYEGRAPSLRKDWQALDNCSKLINAQNLGCSTYRKVTLSDDKNIKLDVPCSQTIPKSYYVLDIDKLLILLERRGTK